jgi:hypothetical protein
MVVHPLLPIKMGSTTWWRICGLHFLDCARRTSPQEPRHEIVWRAGKASDAFSRVAWSLGYDRIRTRALTFDLTRFLHANRHPLRSKTL